MPIFDFQNKSCFKTILLYSLRWSVWDAAQSVLPRLSAPTPSVASLLEGPTSVRSAGEAVLINLYLIVLQAVLYSTAGCTL